MSRVKIFQWDAMKNQCYLGIMAGRVWNIYFESDLWLVKGWSFFSSGSAGILLILLYLKPADYPLDFAAHFKNVRLNMQLNCCDFVVICKIQLLIIFFFFFGLGCEKKRLRKCHCVRRAKSDVSEMIHVLTGIVNMHCILLSSRRRWAPEKWILH